MFGVDLVDDQDNEKAVGGAAGAFARLERGQAGAQVDDVEVDVRAAERHEAVGVHFALELEGLLEELSRRLGVGHGEGQGCGGDLQTEPPDLVGLTHSRRIL